MKPWIIEMTSAVGVAFSEPVDDVTATMLVGLGLTGAYQTRQLNATKSRQREIGDLVESGQLVPRTLKLRIGLCGCAKCQAAARVEEVRMAVPAATPAGVIGHVAIFAGGAVACGTGADAPTAAGHADVVASAGQLQQALPALPVIGGWPLLDLAPSVVGPSVIGPSAKSAPSEQLVMLFPVKGPSLVEKILEWLLGTPRGSEVQP